MDRQRIAALAVEAALVPKGVRHMGYATLCYFPQGLHLRYGFGPTCWNMGPRDIDLPSVRTTKHPARVTCVDCLQILRELKVIR